MYIYKKNEKKINLCMYIYETFRIYSRKFRVISRKCRLYSRKIKIKIHAKMNSMGFRTSQMLFLLQNICLPMKTPFDF